MMRCVCVALLGPGRSVIGTVALLCLPFIKIYKNSSKYFPHIIPLIRYHFCNYFSFVHIICLLFLLYSSLFYSLPLQPVSDSHVCMTLLGTLVIVNSTRWLLMTWRLFGARTSAAIMLTYVLWSVSSVMCADSLTSVYVTYMKM